MRGVQFNTTHYCQAHLTLPRGCGNWFFCPARYYNEHDYLETAFFFSGTFTDAKAAATIHFRRIGEFEIVVCS